MSESCWDKVMYYFSGPMSGGKCLTSNLEYIVGFAMRMMGPLFVLGFYILASLHVYSWFTVVLFVLKKRVGVQFGLIWGSIGLVLLYNVLYNHLFASLVKPGSPKDLKVNTCPFYFPCRTLKL